LPEKIESAEDISEVPLAKTYRALIVAFRVLDHGLVPISIDGCDWRNEGADLGVVQGGRVWACDGSGEQFEDVAAFVKKCIENSGRQKIPQCPYCKEHKITNTTLVDYDVDQKQLVIKCPTHPGQPKTSLDPRQG